MATLRARMTGMNEVPFAAKLPELIMGTGIH